MIRSQVYLTSDERKKLNALSHQTGKSQSELIREAIDLFILQNEKTTNNKLTFLKEAKGLWDDNEDIPDLRELRNELDRFETKEK